MQPGPVRDIDFLATFKCAQTAYESNHQLRWIVGTIVDKADAVLLNAYYA
jgi:hypothetical protein